MGSPQLLGIGMKASITGKHADTVITDDICNITDRISKAIAALDPLIKAAAAADRDGTIAKITEIIGEANYHRCTDIDKLTTLYKAFAPTNE